MKFKLEMQCDNAAFTDYAPGEIKWILLQLAETVGNGIERGDSGPIRDTNGNRIGAWSLK
jgi:hypothetical protein